MLRGVIDKLIFSFSISLSLKIWTADKLLWSLYIYLRLWTLKVNLFLFLALWDATDLNKKNYLRLFNFKSYKVSFVIYVSFLFIF